MNSNTWHSAVIVLCYAKKPYLNRVFGGSRKAYQPSANNPTVICVPHNTTTSAAVYIMQQSKGVQICSISAQIVHCSLSFCFLLNSAALHLYDLSRMM